MGLTHTVSGNIASFRTPSKVPIESLKFHFLPKQAAGTPSPENPIPIEGWAGLNGRRVRKNLYSNIGLIYGKWILGTGEVQEAMRGALMKEIPVSSGEVYSFSFNGSSYLPYSMEVVEYDKDKKYLRRNYSTRDSTTTIPPPNITFTVGSNTKYIICGVFSTENSAITQEKIESYKMQLERGLVSSYEPYSGETIPITFPSNGKNLYDASTYPLRQGYILWSTDGTVDSGYAQFATVLSFIPCENIAGKTVTLNKRSGGVWPGFSFYSSDNVESLIGGLKNNGGEAGTPWTFTVPENAKYMRFTVPANTTDIQIELGTESTSFEPYSSDNTFYGGYIDPVAGEIVAEYALAVAKKENFGEKLTPSSGGMEYRQTGNIYSPTESGVTWSVARQQQKFNLGVIANPWSETAYGNNIGVVITQGNYGLTYMRISETVYQAMSDDDSATISYKLETPIHIPIASQELKAFLDYNNFWSDANDITEVTYAVAESKDILATQKKAIEFDYAHHKKVKWNQHCYPLTSQNWGPYNADAINVVFDNGIATSTWLNTSIGYSSSVRMNHDLAPMQNTGEILYGSYMLNPSKNGLAWGIEMGNVQPTDWNPKPSNEWSRIACTGTVSRSAKNTIYISNLRTAGGSEIGMSTQIKAPILINLTQMFGAGNEPSKAEFERICALNGIDLTTYQPYDTGSDRWLIIP